ncbi:hypothetical protein SO802_009890 [Lithocarpus litseifolius]|uniref:Uncharacterized protein n=1 Tax=Lithocarpus litseifolius TaxID=425828 RepID=A0AAW2DCQ7_9ROSI
MICPHWDIQVFSSGFEAERPGCRFSAKQRIATYFYKGVLYESVGFGCGLIGQGIANMIMNAKRLGFVSFHFIQSAGGMFEQVSIVLAYSRMLDVAKMVFL